MFNSFTLIKRTNIRLVPAARNDLALFYHATAARPLDTALHVENKPATLPRPVNDLMDEKRHVLK